MIKNHFIKGPITPDFVAKSIEKHQVKTKIGAHDIFLGQVRADVIDGRTVKAIEFTAYEEMANRSISELKEVCFDKFNLICGHIYHSIGRVETGDVCFFVFTSSAHRPDAFAGTQFLVNEIKKNTPIFGKEIFDDETHQWKVNRTQ
ncbi:MAG: molybdenum cofactor biosynthesis protein MoaE [Bacteroidota bacterium]